MIASSSDDDDGMIDQDENDSRTDENEEDDREEECDDAYYNTNMATLEYLIEEAANNLAGLTGKVDFGPHLNDYRALCTRLHSFAGCMSDLRESRFGHFGGDYSEWNESGIAEGKEMADRQESKASSNSGSPSQPAHDREADDIERESLAAKQSDVEAREQALVVANEQLAQEKREVQAARATFDERLEAEIRTRLATDEEHATRMQQELATKQSDLEKLEKTLTKEKKQVANDKRAADATVQKLVKKKLAEVEKSKAKAEQAETARKEEEEMVRVEVEMMRTDETESATIVIQKYCRRQLAITERKKLAQETAAVQEQARLEASIIIQKHYRRLLGIAARERLVQTLMQQHEGVVKCTNLIMKWNQSKDLEQPIVAGDTNLLGMLSTTLGTLLNPRNPLDLDKLLSVAADIVCILGPTINANKFVTSYMKGKADTMSSVFSTENATLGSLLDCCNTEGATAGGEGSNIAAEITRLKMAVHSAKYELDSEDISEAEVAGMNIKIVEKFVKVGDPTKNMLTHIFHLVLMRLVLNKLTLAETIAHLSKKNSAALVRDITVLATLVNPHVPFNINMTIQSIMEHYITPGLNMENACVSSAEVFLCIFESMVTINSAKQKEIYKENLLPHVVQAQSMTISGGRDENGLDYCGDGDDRNHHRRWRRIVRLFVHLYLQSQVMKRLPSGIFDKFGGYIRVLLCLSPSDISEHFCFVKKGFFSDYHCYESEAVKRIRTKVLKKRNLNYDERGLLIDSDEQIQALKRLLSMAYNHTT